MKSALRYVRTAALASGLAAAAFAGAASADVSWYFPITAFQDDDLAWVERQGQIITSGDLAVGDRIRGVIEFEQTYSVLPPGNQNTVLPHELTGVYDLTIAGIFGGTAPGGVGCTILTPCGLTIVPTAGAFSVAGTFIRMYLDPTPNLDTVGVNCVSLADCIAKATDGAHWADLGFNGDPNELFAVTNMASINLGALLGAASTSAVGTEVFFLNILTNNTGIASFTPLACVSSGCPAGGDGAVQVIGSGQLKGGQGLTNGAVTRSDVDAQVSPVPEPGVLALISMGMLGAAFARRRRS